MFFYQIVFLSTKARATLSSKKFYGNNTMRVPFLKSVLCSVALALSSVVSASTYWACVGNEFSEDGSVILAGNRDDLPTVQTYMEIRDDIGYSFKGLFVGKNQRFDSGGNEKGLFVATTTAASVPLSERRNTITHRFKTAEGMYAPEWIMRQCASVSDALAHPELFRGYPMNFILADRKEIAIVECLPKGKFNVQRKSVGVLTHANHYTLQNSLSANDKIPASTEARQKRIDSIMNESAPPYTLTQFIALTQDAVEGADLSLFRTGSKPQAPRTLSSIALKIPAKGPVSIYVRYLADPSAKPEWTTIHDTFGK